MHATTQQLLDLRDGAPIDSELVRHIELCAQCSAELKLITDRKAALQALPLQAPSAKVFAQLSEQLAYQQQAPRRNQPLHWAVAAAVVAAIALWLVPTAPTVDDLEHGLNPVAVHAEPSAPAVVAQPHRQERRALIQRSNALEAVAQQLAELSVAEPSLSTNDALSALEAQLALVDYNLNAAQIDRYAPEEFNALLSRRVSTLENLVGVQRAELARQGYHGFQVMTASNIEEEQVW
ncbi:MAG: hypothetical protein AAF465_00605 [Pseudomonadota bacterium]